MPTASSKAVPDFGGASKRKHTVCAGEGCVEAGRGGGPPGGGAEREDAGGQVGGRLGSRPRWFGFQPGFGIDGPYVLHVFEVNLRLAPSVSLMRRSRLLSGATPVSPQEFK